MDRGDGSGFLSVLQPSGRMVMSYSISWMPDSSGMDGGNRLMTQPSSTQHSCTREQRYWVIDHITRLLLTPTGSSIQRVKLCVARGKMFAEEIDGH